MFFECRNGTIHLRMFSGENNDFELFNFNFCAMFDKDLAFLSSASSSDLKVLVDYITHDKSGSPRLTEALTSTKEYKIYYPDKLEKMADSISDELQRYGGNTFANIIRGHGVSYKTLLCDACKKMKVSFNKNSSVTTIEMCLLQHVLLKTLEEMSDSDLKNLIGELNIRTTNFTKQAMMAAVQSAIRIGGFTSYKVAVIVANAVARALLGRGLSFAANAALTRWISVFAGPIGWAVTIAWTALDIAGPAYRVTIPSVIQIAYMRIKSNAPKMIGSGDGFVMYDEANE